MPENYQKETLRLFSISLPQVLLLEGLISPKPTAVLTTSIYSKKDGAVPWQTCMEAKEDDLHKNIEVSSSHIGMPHNKEVLLVIAERLPINSSVSVQKTTSSNQQVKTSLDYK